MHKVNEVFQFQLIVMILVLILLAPILKAEQLVLIFDNTLQKSSSLQAQARSQLLIRNLAVVGVKQVGFLIDTYGTNTDAESQLALYSDKGHLLINAGYNDSLIRKKDLNAMKINVLKADIYLQSYLGYKKHLHFDWLNETEDQPTKQQLLHFFQEHGFRPATSGITPMRFADEYINQLFQKHKRLNKSVDMEKLQKAYVKVLIKDLEQQNALASFTLGYSPVQILTLQENDLAAYFVVGLVDELHKRGWTIIEAEKIFQDPIANSYGFFGFSTNSYWKSVAPFINDAVAYPRVIGNRKAKVDKVLQKIVPELLQ